MTFYRLKSLFRRRVIAPAKDLIRPITNPVTPLFDPAQQDITKYNRERKNRPPATTRYVIHFTPRSGSSWLTDVVHKTGQLSSPDECFNPNFMPRMSAAMNAANMDQYMDILVRRRNTNGVFGCQLTYFHLLHSFNTIDDFMGYFKEARHFWLIREDIVLQAVSLVKMQQTSVAHSPYSDATAITAAEQAFVYNAGQIKKSVDHIFQAEEGNEALFAKYGLSPLRMSYEHNMAMGAANVVNTIAHHIGAPPIPADTFESAHQKLGTDRNTEYGNRFRAEHPRFMARIDAARATRLAGIDHSLPDRLPPGYRT